MRKISWIKFAESIVLLCGFTFCLKAQDPVFSQFNMSPLELNPAFAGNRYRPSISVNYRLQWPGLASTYNTFALSYDQYFDESKLAVGLSVLADDAGRGAIKHNKISGIVGYRLSIDDNTFIKGGVKLSFLQRRLNWGNLVFFDALVANNGVTPGGTPIPSQEVQPVDFNKSFMDIGCGLLFYNPSWYAGLNLDHINKPEDKFLGNVEQNYIGLPLRWSVQGGYQIKVLPQYSRYMQSFISPNLLYTRQGDFSQLNVGAYLAVDMLVGGLWYRQSGQTGDAAIASIGIRTTEWKLAYSFDYTLSDITIKEGGSHELGFTYLFGNDYKKSKINDCLNLFR
jgi:type IX secretion system PorP/SprF family membrane protein